MGARMTSTQPDIVVEEREDGARLTLHARNPVVSWIATTVGGFLAIWPAGLAAYGLRIADPATVVIPTGLAGVLIWLTWRIGWRPRPFTMTFSRDGLEVGPHRFAYRDIRSYGVSGYGGDVVDTVSIGLPRNITIGPHLYVEVGGRHVPGTVGLKPAQAQAAFRAFADLLERHRTA